MIEAAKYDWKTLSISIELSREDWIYGMVDVAMFCGYYGA